MRTSCIPSANNSIAFVRASTGLSRRKDTPPSPETVVCTDTLYVNGQTLKIARDILVYDGRLWQETKKGKIKVRHYPLDRVLDSFAINAHHARDRAAAARRPGLHFNFITGPFWVSPLRSDARRAKGYSMRTQITLHAPLPEGLLCPDCGATVSMKLVEPKLSPPHIWFDVYTFECINCRHRHVRSVDPFPDAGRF